MASIRKENKMYILTNDNVVFITGELIEVGRWENDPTMDTYRIKNGENYQYAVLAFELHEVESLPEDFVPNKYCYTEAEGFYINPSYIEPDKTNTYGIPDETYHAIIDDYTAELFGGENNV